VPDVNKSSYYYWQGHRQPTAHRLRLQVHARAVHTETRQTYGGRRMSAALKAQGLAVGRHRARSLMQEAGLVAVRPKKRHSYPAGEASRVGITYLWTTAGWVYLAVVLDLFSRKVVGWSVSASPDTALILAAPDQAIILRKVTSGIGLLFHSDQGLPIHQLAVAADQLGAVAFQGVQKLFAAIIAPHGKQCRDMERSRLAALRT
jgi:putative transposase